MSHTLNSITDNDTVSTSELLDLIQADVIDAGKKTNGKKTNTNNGGYRGGGGGAAVRPRGSRGGNGSGSRGASSPGKGSRDNNTMVSSMNTNPFSVRLTPSRRRGAAAAAATPFSHSSSGEEDECSGEDDDSVGDIPDFDSYKYSSGGTRMKHRNNNKRSSSANNVSFSRQRMPLGGGYGGMFESDSTGSGSVSHQKNDNQSMSDGDSISMATSLASKSDGSSISSVFSFASKLFTKRKHSNPYSTSSNHSISSRSPFDLHNSFLVNLTRFYLQLPFRLRYFIQLFSIIGVFMLASLNYFIAMENSTPPPHSSSQDIIPQYSSPQQQYKQQQLRQSQPYIMEGGGASPNQIPRLRVRDPLKFLHHDLHPNELLERATAKFRQSTRFGNEPTGSGAAGGNGAGPFLYGWKSMPRQIFNDFATGLSDDTKTIQHENNAQYFQNMAQKQVGFSEHEHDIGKGEKSNRAPPKGTVAYVLPITNCYPEQEDTHANDFHPHSPNHPKNEAAFRDFALMLRATVHAHSYRNPASGSVYDYKMHAILHPRAKKCRSTEELFTVRSGTGDDLENYNGIVDRSVMLQNLGYDVALKNPPLSKESIQGSDYLREYMAKNVVGGEIADLIRLYAYELEEYDAVVLVDYDTLILGPIDKAVDLIVDSNKEDGKDSNDPTGSGEEGNNDNSSIDAVFSWEHLPSLVNPQARASVINLSFFLLHPSKATFADLVKRYQNAPFSETRGWGTIGRGSFPGWMTTQGFLTYYYDEVANAAKVEMNRCAFGNSGEDYNADNSILITNGGKVECGGSGVDGDATANNQCNDCSKSKLEEVSVADLSYCHAPWECGGGGSSDDNNDAAAAASSTSDKLSSGLCRQFQKVWFGGRLQMEDVHPQLQKGSGKLCIDGQYQPMMLLKPTVPYKPQFLD